MKAQGRKTGGGEGRKRKRRERKEKSQEAQKEKSFQEDGVVERCVKFGLKKIFQREEEDRQGDEGREDEGRGEAKLDGVCGEGENGFSSS